MSTGLYARKPNEHTKLKSNMDLDMDGYKLTMLKSLMAKEFVLGNQNVWFTQH